MANTYRGEGKLWNWANSGAAVASGAVVTLVTGVTTGFLGIAETAIAATNGAGALSVGGLHELPMLSTDTGAAGAVVYWDTVNSRLTTTSTSNHLAGRLEQPKTAGQTTAVLALNAR